MREDWHCSWPWHWHLIGNVFITGDHLFDVMFIHHSFWGLPTSWFYLLFQLFKQSSMQMSDQHQNVRPPFCSTNWLSLHSECQWENSSCQSLEPRAAKQSVGAIGQGGQGHFPSVQILKTQRLAPKKAIITHRKKKDKQTEKVQERPSVQTPPTLKEIKEKTRRKKESRNNKWNNNKCHSEMRTKAITM